MPENLTTKPRKPRLLKKPSVLNMFYGYPAELVAQWCCISIQTAHKYKLNTLKPSKQSVALFRLHADKRIIPRDWEGWAFHDGKLFNPQEVPLTQAQLEAYQYIYKLASEYAPERVYFVVAQLQNVG